MRRIVLLLALSIILTITHLAIAAPSIKCTEYRSGEKIDHSRVSCYLQDSKGLLWLGTWIGLCRYDGKEFRYFNYGLDENPVKDNPSLGSNRILKMSLDSYENIWCINYDHNVCRFDRATSTMEDVLFRVKDRLPSSVWVEAVFVTAKNHAVWIALKDGTLIRFNAADLSDNVVLPGATGQKNKHIFLVTEDGKGREWILTDQGVMIYGKGFLSDCPYARFAEKDGYCVLATRDGRLAEYMEDGTLRSIELPVKVNMVYDMKKQRYSDVSISTDAGLFMYNCQTRKLRFINKTYQGGDVKKVKQVFCDSKERLWFYADGDGVFCLIQGDSLVHFLKNPDAGRPLKNENGNLNLFMEDVHGYIWVKPTLGELCYVDEETFTLRNYKEGSVRTQELPFTDYKTVFIDNQRNFWISSGTQMYHLNVGLKQFHELDCDPGVEVRSLLAEDECHVLCGDRVGHLYRINIETGQRKFLSKEGQWVERPVALFSSGVYAMKRDSRGRIWIGTRGDGLACMRENGNGYKLEYYRPSGNEFDLNCEAIYDIYEDECSRIWLATFGGGVNLLDEQPDGTIRFLNASNQMFNYPPDFDYVRCLSGDGHGRIFAGTNSGLIAFSSHFQHLSDLSFNIYQSQSQQENPLQDNVVMKVLCGSDGTFYVCTFCRGMSRIVGEGLEKLQFETIPNRDFSAGNVNYTGFISKSGRIWTVSESGLTCFNLQLGKQWYFNEQDNDAVYTLTECTPIELSNGKVVLGMNGGLVVFQEDGLRKSHFAPKIVFTEREYAVGVNQMRELINDIDTLVIEPDKRASILHFASLDLVPSPYVRYAYSMQGEDNGNEQWIRTQEPSINLMNMPPGRYRLRVRSCNADAVWCDNTRSLVIIIQPTFLERWLKWIIALLAIAIIVPVAWVQIRKRERRVEAVAKKEIASAKIEMLSSPANRADQEFIQKLMQMLEDHLSDGNLQVNDLADEMNMSRATFYRRLKQAVDLSPNDFIHQVRMSRSAEMLTKTDNSVAQIAYAVGFNNPKYFSKCFRQDFGISPVDYRAKSREKQDTDENVES